MGTGIGRLANAVVVFSAVIAIPSLLFLLVAFIELLFLPPVLTYTNVPFPVEDKKIPRGAPVVFFATRCANDPFSPDPMSYTFTSTLRNIETGEVTGIPDNSTDMPHGCQQNYKSALNSIPLKQPPGKYIVQGISTAKGLFKVSMAKWSTEEFEVVTDESVP